MRSYNEQNSGEKTLIKYTYDPPAIFNSKQLEVDTNVRMFNVSMPATNIGNIPRGNACYFKSMYWIKSQSELISQCVYNARPLLEVRSHEV